MNIAMRTKHLLTILAVAAIGTYGLNAKTKKTRQVVEEVQPAHDVAKATVAEWTTLVYIQADNSLAPFAADNISDMQAGMHATDQANLLVQWDQPGNNKSWRYRIVPGNKVEDHSLSSEMGVNPAAEIVTAMQWAQTKYPARHYALVLWNHGSGIEDFRNPLARTQKKFRTWMEIPGLNRELVKDRGILYDDTQGTVLTNQGLTTALTQVKANLGKNLDIIGMDACLMAMLEVGYQVNNCADYLVGSQQTEPGQGWAYSLWINPLTSNPTGFSSLKLAQAMVAGYGVLYQNNTDAPDYTQSAMQISALNALKNNVNLFVSRVDACSKINAVQTKVLIKAARQQATEFYMPEYIDLYSFYAALANRLGKKTPKSDRILERLSKNEDRLNPSFIAAQNALKQTALDGMQLITSAVVANVSGSEYPNVKGISIYYPSSGKLHASYAKTLFAKDSTWTSFLGTYRR